MHASSRTHGVMTGNARRAYVTYHLSSCMHTAQTSACSIRCNSDTLSASLAESIKQRSGVCTSVCLSVPFSCNYDYSVMFPRDQRTFRPSVWGSTLGQPLLLTGPFHSHNKAMCFTPSYDVSAPMWNIHRHSDISLIKFNVARTDAQYCAIFCAVSAPRMTTSR